MPDLPEKDPKRLDEELASFTDQVLSGEPASQSMPGSLEPDLERLEHTVLRLKSAFGPPAQPPQAAAQRIRQRLAQEWQQRPPFPASTLPEDDGSRSSWQSWLRRRFGFATPARRQRTLTLAFSALAVITLLVVFVFSPPSSAGQPAAAGSIPGIVVFIFLAAAALVAFFWGKLKK